MGALVSYEGQRIGLSMVVVLAAKATVKAARVVAVCAVIVRSNGAIRKPMHATSELNPSTFLVCKTRMIEPSLILFAGVMTKTLTPLKITYSIQRITSMSPQCLTMMDRRR